jgi:hypothetical protein
MSDKQSQSQLLTLNRIELVLAVVIALGTVASCIASWGVLPYRVTKAEESIAVIQNERRIDHDVLIRVDENVKQLIQKLDEPK